VPSGPVREVDQLIPTAPAGAAGAAGATGEVPTALPLAQAVEGDSADVIAEVGGGSILRGDFARLYQPGSSAAELLDQLIQLELVVQAAADEGVAVDEAAVSEQVAQIKTAQAGGDQAMFEQFLTQNRIGGEDELRRLLARDQLVEQMILRHTTGEQVHARHILIATENVTATEEARVQAEGLIEQLDGGADFAALASEHSADTGSAMNGGDLGWALRGMYVPEFDEAVFSMGPGERRLVQTQFGYHIIEVLEPATVQGLQSSDLLQTGPGQQAFAETFIPWVDGLKAAADEAQSIKILIPAEELVTTPAQ
jgi:peptidyl-prolyl cis-trans isomerase C